MNRPLEPTDNVGHPLFRMDTGVDVLEKWAEDASQREKDVVYAALFAMTDHSLFRTYPIVEDGLELSDFSVPLQDGLVMKMRVHCFDSFGLIYLGPKEDAGR
jgi:hypothetical protein